MRQDVYNNGAEVRSHAGEFLSFRLGGEEYGIDILKVQEIRGYEVPTRIANAPQAVLGVLNLRGVIVPVIDMRLKFHLTEAPYNSQTVTIVLTIGGRVVGMVVDSVSAVIALAQGQIRPAPTFSAAVATDHLIGIASPDPEHPEQLIILMDIERLMCSADVRLVSDRVTEQETAETV
ncbi:chemotaxis protein CheW [Hydrogenophaga sp. IBVHS2]|uniref:chemotaxis protein CheW n=1 Tax=Hydrogenophaga sp. IBVHS2 TaxID=1985170 RepID=UPI000A2DF0E8|nr:chemotaxis protein CheW [Hydrogenophaga sp. IBVHS2]OSZ67377.1 chemotaxis protein CheW [Hydrogenophaga sp. IBVHS2]